MLFTVTWVFKYEPSLERQRNSSELGRIFGGQLKQWNREEHVSAIKGFVTCIMTLYKMKTFVIKTSQCSFQCFHCSIWLLAPDTNTQLHSTVQHEPPSHNTVHSLKVDCYILVHWSWLLVHTLGFTIKFCAFNAIAYYIMKTIIVIVLFWKVKVQPLIQRQHNADWWPNAHYYGHC